MFRSLKLSNGEADLPEDDQNIKTTQARFSFTSVLVVMAVFGAVAASLAHLWRAANGDQAEIGRFVIVTAMSPLLLLVFASIAFRIVGRFFK